MGVNFTTMMYLPVYDMFAVPVVFSPYSSQPGLAPYSARGIFDTRPNDVMAMDGSVYSDQQTILDIREIEFSVIPKQGDQVRIPADCNGVNQGDWEVVDADANGGGETTLLLKKVVF